MKNISHVVLPGIVIGTVRLLALTMALLSTMVSADAQWLTQPAYPIPRMKNGEPNLTASPPRAANGKPDLSGVWQAEGSPIPELIAALAGFDAGEGGLGEDRPVKYFVNILADFRRGAAPLRPAALAAEADLSLSSARRDDVGVNCLPPSVPMTDTLPSPFKLIQSPRVTVMLVEGEVAFRQIFTDNRKLPQDPRPTWLGYSIVRWGGNKFIVETAGFNDRSQLDVVGHRHSTALRVIECVRCPPRGHARSSCFSSA